MTVSDREKCAIVVIVCWSFREACGRSRACGRHACSEIYGFFYGDSSRVSEERPGHSVFGSVNENDTYKHDGLHRPIGPHTIALAS